MQDKTYGWTVEMQLKVLRKRISYIEIPVRYKNRIGASKVSGTVKGTIMAGIKIIGWILNTHSNNMLLLSYIILFIYSLAILLIFSTVWHNSICLSII